MGNKTVISNRYSGTFSLFSELGFHVYEMLVSYIEVRFEKRATIKFVFWLSIFCVGMITGCGTKELPYATPHPDYLNLLDLGPCWNNICPGQTSVQEAETSLGSLSIVNEIYKPKSGKYMTVDLDGARFGQSYIRLNYSDLIVNQIEILIREKNLTLSQAIEYLGYPTYIAKMKTCFGGDIASPHYRFVLWYLAEGITIFTGGLYTYQATDLIVESNLGVYKIVYHVSNSSVENWPQLANLGWNEEQVYLDNLHPWPGWDGSIPSYIDTCE